VARPALATLADLEALLGRTVADSTQSLARLDRASAIVRAFAGRTWLNDDETELVDVPADIPGVVAEMVVRAERTGSATQQSAGEFQVSYGADAARGIYLTADDKLIIRAAIGAASSGIGVLSTTRGPLETGNVAGPYGGFPTEDLASLTGLLGT